MSEMNMRERVLEGMAAALKAHCTNRQGECYAHGFTSCRQEGGWPGEVDGEFDLEVIFDAVLDVLAEPDEGMIDMMLARMGCSHLKDDPAYREARVEEWQAVIDAARTPGAIEETGRRG